MSDADRDWSIRPAVAGDVGGLIPLLPAPGLGVSLLPTSSGNGGRQWLLVAVRGPGEAVAGCVRVRRAIGLDRPRFWYHVGCAVHAAPELELFHRQRTLLLGNDLTGAWEIADLLCDTATLGGEAQVTTAWDMEAEELVFFAGLRAFFDVSSQLWADLLAALRVDPYPLALEVRRAVDVVERALIAAHEDFRAFLGFLGVLLGFLVWYELRCR
jgi:hypothetical protein